MGRIERGGGDGGELARSPPGRPPSGRPRDWATGVQSRRNGACRGPEVQTVYRLRPRHNTRSAWASAAPTPVNFLVIPEQNRSFITFHYSPPTGATPRRTRASISAKEAA